MAIQPALRRRCLRGVSCIAEIAGDEEEACVGLCIGRCRLQRGRISRRRDRAGIDRAGVIVVQIVRKDEVPALRE